MTNVKNNYLLFLGVSTSDAELLFSLSTSGVTAKGLSDLAWKARATGQKLSEKELETIKRQVDRESKLTVDPHTGNKAGEYLEDFKPSSTPAELVQQQAGKGTQVTINTEHILNGEIKTYANGTKVGTGGHYLKDPNIRVDTWTGAADANGVTKGYISVRDPATGKWYKKQAETTFFPEHWSKRQTEMEIKSAFGNSKPKPGESEKWIGTSSSGIKMEGYYKRPNGTGAKRGLFIKERKNDE
ncbi:EndoU domain-containing protein [Gilliamella sp. Pas-s95]|uniref:EndoU domain-containing protein n=1 Tax=Gilliamella sp. Pas-s95 TaxID=2687317 RepID=UPI001326B85C|nr:EndoU domain-containing protein [Gilliamella sp. Pas-s95]MWN05376.1 hypothetical protein [Gilliamella sp. Pas-s95]